jgi:hypothetical protein
MTPPESLIGLVSYLAERPRVRVTYPPGLRQVDQVLRFDRQQHGGLWWRGETDRQEHFTPIDCGKTAAESGFAFDAAGFTMTKFGQAIRFDYVPEPVQESAR